MKVLITGANGRFGKHVVNELRDHGHTPVLLDIKPGRNEHFESLLCDCTDLKSLAPYIQKVDSVIHLAAIPSPGRHTDSEIFQANCVGTYNIFSACVDAGIRKIAIASSINALGAYYGIKPLNIEYFPIDEQHPQLCSDAYSFSKKINEETARFFWLRYGISSISARMSFIREPDYYKSKEKGSHKTSDPGHKMLKDNFWTHIDARDAARLMVLGIEHPYEGAHVLHCNDSYNSVGIPSKDLAQKYFPDVTEWRKDILGNEALVSCDYAKTLLGWEPLHHLSMDGCEVS